MGKEKKLFLGRVRITSDDKALHARALRVLRRSDPDITFSAWARRVIRAAARAVVEGDATATEQPHGEHTRDSEIHDHHS